MGRTFSVYFLSSGKLLFARNTYNTHSRAHTSREKLNEFPFCMPIVRKDSPVEKGNSSVLRVWVGSATYIRVLERLRRRKKPLAGEKEKNGRSFLHEKSISIAYSQLKKHIRERKSRDECKTFSVQFLVGLSLVRNIERFGRAKNEFSPPSQGLLIGGKKLPQSVARKREKSAWLIDRKFRREISFESFGAAESFPPNDESL